MYKNDMENCGKMLLTIVARGTAIITEISRLVELTPTPFKQNYFSHKGKRFTLMNNLVCDFGYFRDEATFESRIEGDEALKRADEEFCDQYFDLISRIYLTFESIQRYASDLNGYIRDLEDGVFVGQSIESLLTNIENRQLLCEAYFNLGYMLMTVDNNFNGSLRESIIVAYYRYSAYRASPETNLDETCNLLRSTGLLTQSKYYRPENYPENYFSRAQVDQSVVNLLIAKMQSVDIYNQTTLVFPHPDHRSNALAQQASILYVLLYFCPNVLKTQRSRMREITDKFFYDNWVISLSMGELVNLFEAWEPYKAARESLMQIIDSDSVISLSKQFNQKFFITAKRIQGYLREGWLNEATFLQNHSKILNDMREGNVVLKWILLHSKLYDHWQSKIIRTLHSIAIANQPDTTRLCIFLQDLANLERRSTTLCDKLLKSRFNKFGELKALCLDLLDELVSIYSDDKPMRWVKAGANSSLAQVLTRSRTSLDSVSFEDEASRDSIISLVNSIESAQEAYSDGQSLQIVQLFVELKGNLLNLLKYFSLNEDLHLVIQTASDFGYAWRLIDEKFTRHLQQMIKLNPLEIQLIEAIFLKLASASDTQLLRIQQVGARADLVSVSQYYSSKLVAYIQDVLHIVPATILELVSKIITLQTHSALLDMPSEVALNDLKDYGLREQRSLMLELTYKISHYAEGMMQMQGTTVGLMRINSRKLLEDGIRRELVHKLSESIRNTLFPPSGIRAGELIDRLQQLTLVINGFRRSFEYIQDYLFIYGLRMWQEELSRIIRLDVERAALALLEYDGKPTTINVLAHEHSDDDPLQSSFIIRVLQELLQITDPLVTMYDEQANAWYFQDSKRQTVDLKVFELIKSSLTVAGLNGLDQLCCSVLVLDLERLHADMVDLCKLSNRSCLHGAIHGLRNSRVDCKSFLRNVLTAMDKIEPSSENFLNRLVRIGQLQAIRMNISCVLSTKCRYDARHLYACLETLNAALISTLKHPNAKRRACAKVQLEEEILDDQRQPKSASFEPPRLANIDDSQLVFEVTNHLEWIGLHNPMEKIHTLGLQQQDTMLLEMCFLLLLSQSPKFAFSQLTPHSSSSDPLQRPYGHGRGYDFQTIIYGITTLLNHCEPTLGAHANRENLKERLLKLIGYYVRCLLANTKSANNASTPPRMLFSMIEISRLFGGSLGALLSGFDRLILLTHQ